MPNLETNFRLLLILAFSGFIIWITKYRSKKMRNINRHKSSDKQSIMTESSFALTILLIVEITVTVGTMVLTVFFNLSLPIKIAVSAILIPDSIISMIFTISTAVKERKSTGDFYFGSRFEILGFCLVMIAWSVIIFLI